MSESSPVRRSISSFEDKLEIGSGTYGIVYKTDETTCTKVFVLKSKVFSKEDCLFQELLEFVKEVTVNTILQSNNTSLDPVCPREHIVNMITYDIIARSITFEFFGCNLYDFMGQHIFNYNIEECDDNHCDQQEITTITTTTIDKGNIDPSMNSDIITNVTSDTTLNTTDDVTNVFVKRDTYLNNNILNIRHQLLKALQYLSTQGIVHGDLSITNVLLECGGCGSCTQGEKGLTKVKICDFGSSLLSEIKSDDNYNYGCTINVAPPECSLYGPYGGTKSDIWCVGILLLYMFDYKEYDKFWTEKNSIHAELTKNGTNKNGSYYERRATHLFILRNALNTISRSYVLLFDKLHNCYTKMIKRIRQKMLNTNSIHHTLYMSLNGILEYNILDRLSAFELLSVDLLPEQLFNSYQEECANNIKNLHTYADTSPHTYSMLLNLA